jgi:hypothetical protein
VCIGRSAGQQSAEYTETLVNNTKDNFISGTSNGIDLLFDAPSKASRYAFRRDGGRL